MSQYIATMIVVNATGQTISGTASHWSGDGANHLESPTFEINLGPFQATSPLTFEARTNHGDYWFWTPSNGAAVREEKNLDRSAGAVLVVTDDLLVVVTSENGINKKDLPQSIGEAAVR